MSDVERYSLSQKLMERLEKHPRFVEAHTVMLFHSLPDEVHTHELLERYVHRKQVLLPVVKGCELQIVPYSSDENLVSGAFGISEPRGEHFSAFQNIDLIVVPGLAFDRYGHRLGRGRGFYDRFLSQPALQNVYKLGVCFPCQLQVEVPVGEHDVKMDELLC